MSPNYTRIIVHQFDPELPVPGGVDTCLRDMLAYPPPNERVLLIGVSQSRPLHKKSTLQMSSTAVDFIPVSRANPGNQARLVPHSLRIALAALPHLFRNATKRTVLQFHRIEVGILARLFRAQKRAYFIHTNTNQSLRENSDSFWRRAPKLYRLIENIVLKGANITVVFNRSTFEELKQEGHKVARMSTWFNDSIYFPPPSPRSHIAISDKPLSVLWVGRLEAPKDPLLAIEVFKSLELIRDTATLPLKYVVVGDGTLRPEVERLVRDLGIVSKVELIGSRSRWEVGEQMRNADCLLMTSHFEGSPRVLYEAMGCGLPVVASKEADADAVIVTGLNGTIARERNAESLSAAVLDALKQPVSEVCETVRTRAASIAVRDLWRITGAIE